MRIGGARTSLRRVLRLMREHDLLAPIVGQTARSAQPRWHDHSGWHQHHMGHRYDHDLDQGECVGIHVARRRTRFEALEALRQEVRR